MTKEQEWLIYVRQIARRLRNPLRRFTYKDRRALAKMLERLVVELEDAREEVSCVYYDTGTRTNTAAGQAARR